jgi:uncharacterized membrane protein HdeD (DUF308 family)
MTTATFSAADITKPLSEKLKKNKKLYFWMGLGIAITGLAAMLFPMVSSLSLTLFLGVTLLVSGVLATIGSFSISGTGPFFGSLLLGLLKIAAGTIVLMNPLAGMIYLTSLLAIVFIFEGAFEMSYAFELKPHKGWGWQIFSGVISVLCGAAIITSLPSASLWMVGFIVGINMVSSGLAAIFISRNIGALASRITES